jgi:hypothetical protein
MALSMIDGAGGEDQIKTLAGIGKECYLYIQEGR